MDPNDVIDHFAALFARTAEWRSLKAEQFPDDRRNAVAARRLRRLAEDADNMSAETARAYAAAVAAIDEAPDDLGLVVRDIEGALLRDVGFRTAPALADEFVRLLTAELERVLTIGTDMRAAA